MLWELVREYKSSNYVRVDLMLKMFLHFAMYGWRGGILQV